MTFDWMDARDWQLLKLLQANARTTFAELGRRVKLTPPAVAERVRRMEDQGVIGGYSARVNLAAVGRGMRVFLRVQVLTKEYPKFIRNRAGAARNRRVPPHHGRRVVPAEGGGPRRGELEQLIRSSASSARP